LSRESTRTSQGTKVMKIKRSSKILEIDIQFKKLPRPEVRSNVPRITNATKTR
jgi:hypothetical protein